MGAKEDEFLKLLQATFKIEAAEHVQTISSQLMALEKTDAPAQRRSLVEVVFRAAHSLKGAARAVNFSEIESVCQSMEDMFASWKREETAPSGQALDSVHRALNTIGQYIEDPRPAAVPSPPPRPAPTPFPPVASLAPQPAPLPLPVEAPVPVPAASRAEDTVRIAVSKLDARLLEAEEMLAIKLSAAQRTDDLAELARQVETLDKQWTAIQPDLRALRQDVERALPEGRRDGRMHRLLSFLETNQAECRALGARVASIHRALRQDQFTANKLVDDLLADSKKLLMLPVASISILFPKIVRDLCRDQGKEADLVIEGGDFEIDKRVLEEMKDPLIHVLRNCVAHGIETPEQRRRHGKSARARIQLSVSPVNGNKVEIRVSDDGAGVNLARVKESAVAHGAIGAHEAARLNESEILELVFRSDVSTSPMITQISGRGLGMAIVRQSAEKLGGKVAIESQPNAGATVRILLPVALATFRGLILDAAGQLFIVPTAQVSRVARFRPADVKTVENRETLSLNGAAVALARLGDILGLAPLPVPDEAPSSSPAIVVGEGDQRVAFAVNEVLDEQEVLVKRFTKPLVRVRDVAGAAVLGSGRVALILNLADLLKSARGVSRAPVAEAAKKSAAADSKAILLAEDSITSRMLLKGILESAGFRVQTAVDGLDALSSLRAQPFDLVVSDVEMPRLNGFELTTRIRADKKLAEIPVILVTALETPTDRERGLDAGANAYLVKRSFDQSNLLDAVRRLV